MINLAQLFSLKITPFLCAGLQRCLVLPTAVVGISKAAPSPHSPLPDWQEKQAGRDDLGGENTTLVSSHKQGRHMAVQVGDANVQHPTAAQGGMGGMSLALPPPPQHLCHWLMAPLHVLMLPSVAQSSAPVLPGTVPREPGAE